MSTQLIKPNYLVILPPMQHHSFFRNIPPLFVSITSFFEWFNWFDWFNFFGLLVQQSNSWVWISNSQIMFSLMTFNYQTNWQSVKLFSNFSLGFVIFPGSTGEWNLNHCSWNDIFAANLYLFIYFHLWVTGHCFIS